jgi:hypothetical protein
MGNYNYFYVAPPRRLESVFFWECPLFSVERGALTLHVGKPDGVSDEAFASRCSTLGFGGLHSLTVHCQTPPSAQVLSALAGLFAPFTQQPRIETRLDNA